MHPIPLSRDVAAARDAAEPRLVGLPLRAARLAWVLAAGPAIGFFIIALPALYRTHLPPPVELQDTLDRLGWPHQVYAAYWVGILSLFAIGCLAVAGLVVRTRPTEPMALFSSLVLILLGTVNIPANNAVAAEYPGLQVPISIGLGLAVVCLFLFLFLFPNGQFVPTWTRGVAALWAVGFLLTTVPSGLSAWSGVFLIGGLLSGGATQIYRYRRVAGPVERQQVKWVVFGTASAIVIQVGGIAIYGLSTPGLRAVVIDLLSLTVVTIGFFLVPLSIGIAVLRYRLWELDLIINRTLVYGVLTLGIVASYLMLVLGVGALLVGQGNLVLSLVATGVVAIGFQPMRDRLQRAVNRLLYGERDDPYTVVSRLGQRLEATLAPDAVLRTITETVTETLRLPYAAIVLGEGTTGSIVVASGQYAPNVLRLPLVYHQTVMGELQVAPRRGTDGFTPVDQRLLRDLARQAGIAAYATRLTAELQSSREQLVLAREEERRRLRRDLHDGLGPQLAGLTLKLETARNHVEDAERVDALLAQATTQAEAAIADIRRLVYALRPPALDELGLVPALRQTANQLSSYGADGLLITLTAADDLPDLPAAIEVAAYRIVQEAMTNVVRHAGARTCEVRITFDTGVHVLSIEVVDDGCGTINLDTTHGGMIGVGFQTMRERADELGGTCAVISTPGGGTRVVVQLPCRNETSVPSRGTAATGA